ncbi:MAG TPA: EAL domain-containing protein [Solirubrobacterales bacterium]|jgi:diguanylate cyclase (GGDEF)-like protein/PAS domain S-box-containing protein|nr:EAL domain-containing protein [Solirubrobacterales bacterium]
MEPAPRGEGWPDRVSDFLDEISSAGEDYRRLVERLPAIVYSSEMGERGRWRYVSPQIEEILGYTPEEWMADPTLWASQLHPDDRERALEQEDRKAAGQVDFPPVDYRMITRDGAIVWILDEAVLEPDAHGTPVWHGVLYDITERKLAEQELRRAAAQQAAVARLGRQALQDGDPSRLMHVAATLMTEIEGVEAACVWEAGREGRRLHLRAGLEGRPLGGEHRASAARDSHAGAALESGLHVIVDDWSAERRFTMPPALRVLGVRSSLAVPIAGKERPFGVFDIHSTEPSRFTPQDVHFVQASANVLADAFERHRADEALRHRVLHDALTGLPNRLSFIDSLQDALRRSTASGSPVGVLFLDLDHFKLINDSIGHHAGDDLLRAVAPRLRAHLRPGDIVARFGGDEFGVLVDRLADEEEAIAIADRVTGAFSEPYTMGGAEHFVSASIGIAVARPAGRDPVDAELLIRDADAAMYRAKERGRGRSEMFDAEMRARAVHRLETERELCGALERDELELHYQPVIALGSGEIVGLEALVRWNHPERGVLDPGQFVSIAEESGLIEPIGRWVQESACRQALGWHALQPDRRPLDISVNLSARQVAHRDLPVLVEDVLKRTGLEPVNLRLEITESVLVEESANATATLAALSELGVRLVLDDFGTGYSSLAYLNRFPFDALKIDRSFIEGLGIEQERTAIVEAVIGMARALSLDAIAEGVENEAQLAELRRLGCDFAQGHLFSRPLAPEKITHLLREGSFELLGDAAR